MSMENRSSFVYSSFKMIWCRCFKISRIFAIQSIPLHFSNADQIKAVLPPSSYQIQRCKFIKMIFIFIFKLGTMIFNKNLTTNKTGIQSKHTGIVNYVDWLIKYFITKLVRSSTEASSEETTKNWTKFHFY